MNITIERANNDFERNSCRFGRRYMENIVKYDQRQSIVSKSDREREREREIDQYFVLYWQEHFTFKINFHKEISATHLHTQEHMCNIHFVLQDMHALE